MNTDDRFDFDFAEYKRRLLDACRQGFTFLSERQRGEHFYVYGILRHPLGHWATPIGNTEECLAQVAQQYLDRGWYTDIDLAIAEMRWGIGDFPLAGPVAEFLNDHSVYEFDVAINQVLATCKLRDTEGRARSNRFHQALLEVVYAVLNELSEEGHFGSGQDRDRVAVTVLDTQFSYWDLLVHAYRVNPPRAFQRLKAELAPQPVERFWEMYRRLGAVDWIDRGYDHYYRGDVVLAETVMLARIWKTIIAKNDFHWMDECILASDQGRADTSLGAHLKRLLEQGCDRSDVNEVVREVQKSAIWSVLFHCLRPPPWDRFNPVPDLVPEFAKFEYALFQVDAEGRPIAELDLNRRSGLSALAPDEAGNWPSHYPWES